MWDLALAGKDALRLEYLGRRALVFLSAINAGYSA